MSLNASKGREDAASGFEQQLALAIPSKAPESHTTEPGRPAFGWRGDEENPKEAVFGEWSDPNTPSSDTDSQAADLRTAPLTPESNARAWDEAEAMNVANRQLRQLNVEQGSTPAHGHTAAAGNDVWEPDVGTTLQERINYAQKLHTAGAKSPPASRYAPDDTSIEAYTMLDDEEFYNTPEGQAFIPSAEQFELLSRAHCLTQEIIYGLYVREWPYAVTKTCFGGAHEVRLGLEDHLRDFGSIEVGPPPVTEIMGDHIHGVRQLRNALAHYQSTGPKRVDELIKEAQRLACKVNDLERAGIARELRNRVRELACTSYAEIMDDEQADGLTERMELPHHQRYFAYLSQILSQNATMYFPYWVPEVREVARRWYALYHSPGEMRSTPLAKATILW